jgi:hypothetical protein
MKRVLAGTILAIAASTAALLAQGRDFAGVWVVDSERTAAANPAGFGGGGRGGAGGGGVARSGGSGGTIAGVEQRRVTGDGAAGRGGGGLRGAGGVITPAQTTISLDAAAFTIASATTTTAYKLDGSTTTTETPRGTVTAKASWNGDRLVIETTSPGANGPIVTTAAWYRDGASLVRENASPGLDGELIVRKTYYKKS